jgi:hypothetical protein
MNGRDRGFARNAKTCILVNGVTTEVQTLPQAGLPQGSALAPILFLFFNADLVQSAPRHDSSMAFVDDYSNAKKQSYEDVHAWPSNHFNIVRVENDVAIIAGMSIRLGKGELTEVVDYCEDSSC